MSGTVTVTSVATTRSLERPRDGVLDVDYAWMSARAPDWDDLVARAQDATPFFSRQVVDAHVRHRIAPAPRFATVWRAGRLVGLLPYRTRLIGPVPGRVAWGSPFVTSSTPLVARDGLDEHVGSLLSACRTIGGCWLLPRLTRDDAFGASILRQIGDRDWQFAVFEPFARPLLSRQESLASFETRLSPGRRKDLRRRRRRLDEAGTVTLRSAEGGAGLTDAIEAFLALEQAGWKGRRGTALASRPETAAFARTLFGGERGTVRGRADLLCLDGRPIAASLALIAGRTAFMLKSAYDEDLGRYAPGILLEDAIIRELHATTFADKLDSATEPGTPLDDLYRERARIGDVLFSTGRYAGFAPSLAGELLRRSIKQRLKRSLAALKSLSRR